MRCFYRGFYCEEYCFSIESVNSLQGVKSEVWFQQRTILFFPGKMAVRDWGRSRDLRFLLE